MVGPDAPSASATGWLEGFGAFLLLILTLGGQAWRYMREGAHEETAPRHIVLEQAELADMGPLRQILQRLDALLELHRDIVEMRKDDHRILELLERIDRADEIEREVRARLRDENRY